MGSHQTFDPSNHDEFKNAPPHMRAFIEHILKDGVDILAPPAVIDKMMNSIEALNEYLHSASDMTLKYIGLRPKERDAFLKMDYGFHVIESEHGVHGQMYGSDDFELIVNPKVARLDQNIVDKITTYEFARWVDYGRMPLNHVKPSLFAHKLAQARWPAPVATVIATFGPMIPDLPALPDNSGVIDAVFRGMAGMGAATFLKYGIAAVCHAPARYHILRSEKMADKILPEVSYMDYARAVEKHTDIDVPPTTMQKWHYNLAPTPSPITREDQSQKFCTESLIYKAQHGMSGFRPA